MFKTRLISGILLIIVAFGLIYAGGWVLLAGLGVISLIGMFELNRTIKSEKSIPAYAGYLAAVVYYLLLAFASDAGTDSLPISFFVLFLIVLMGVYVFSFPKYESNQVMNVFFGFVYVAVMLSYIYRTRLLDGGIYLVWLTFLSSWGCDTCAYCVGMLIGKHKMAPKLSPKKSVEGGIGGIVGAGLLGLIFGLVFHGALKATLTNPALDCAVI